MARKGIYTFHIYNQEVRGAVACQVLNVIFNKTQSQLSLQPMSTMGYQCSYMAITKNKIEKKKYAQQQNAPHIICSIISSIQFDDFFITAFKKNFVVVLVSCFSNSLSHF